MIIKCSNCGKLINRSSYRLKCYSKQFCSNECIKQSKTKNKLKHNCKVCGKEFEFLPSRLKYSKRLYCSHKCSCLDKRNGKIKNCLVCGKKIYVSISQDKNGKGKYCSRKCFNLINKGETHPSFKNGYYLFKKHSKSTKNKKCSLCGETKKIDSHHKDGNKNNNKKENWIFVCRSCHLRIHKLSERCLIELQTSYELIKKFKLYELTKTKFHQFIPPVEYLSEQTLKNLKIL